MVHFGLIGARLGHSLSPQIHQLIFKELGVEGTYDLLEIPPEELYASVHELRGKYCGVNVTIPHKINVMAALTTLSMEAQAIGAVNTIHFYNGAIRGRRHFQNVRRYNRKRSGPVWQQCLVADNR